MTSFQRILGRTSTRSSHWSGSMRPSRSDLVALEGQVLDVVVNSDIVIDKLKVAATSLKLEIRLHAHQVGTNT